VARTSIRTWVLGSTVLVLGVALAVALFVRRALENDARRVAERLLGCPHVEVRWTSTGFADHWRVEGCGRRGTMVCEPTDPGCFFVPDDG
jgi:hypothetical protein